MDDTTLTLPGTIPGLLRRGSPVVVDGGPVGGVVLDVYMPPEWTANEGRCLLDQGHSGDIALDLLALDLSDATGRAHAAWRLAERHTGAVNQIGALFEMTILGPLLILGTPSWVSDVWGVSCQGLDYRDPRTLTDGSRWVDAEALRLVCLHVMARV